MMKREHSMLGANDEAYGVGLWVARIENLQSHLRIIADYLPEDADWLRNQVRCAMAEADRYLADYSPLCDSGSRAERQDPEEGLGPEDGRAAEGIAQPQVLRYKTIYRDVV